MGDLKKEDSMVKEVREEITVDTTETAEQTEVVIVGQKKCVARVFTEFTVRGDVDDRVLLVAEAGVEVLEREGGIEQFVLALEAVHILNRLQFLGHVRQRGEVFLPLG